jgi:hypothetical protein
MIGQSGAGNLRKTAEQRISRRCRGQQSRQLLDCLQGAGSRAKPDRLSGSFSFANKSATA